MKSFLTLSVLLILNSFNLFGQWQSDTRLTNSGGNSYTSRNGWCICTSGENVHAIWKDFRDGNYEIYYKRSTDGGVSWEADIRLTNNTGQSENPSITVSGSDVHVVWQDDRDGGNHEIYYKRSSDGGITWGADTRQTNNVYYSEFPVVAALGSNVHIVWYDIRYQNREIYYKRSTDGGVTWGADTRLANDTTYSWFASIAVSGSLVHVVWEDYRDANFEIYYKRSTDGGTSWEADTRLTNDLDNSKNPSISVSGSDVYVVWADFRDDDYEIYYKRSSDGGITWGTDSRLTISPSLSYYPSISVSGATVHVVWEDFRDGNNEIYYKRSTDGGLIWGADTRLTNDPAGRSYSSIAVSGSVVHVVWSDFRDGNFEIYYKRDPSGNVTGIENINLEFPEEFRLEQNYPNPFNPSTSIQYRVSSISQVILKVYDVLGNEVATLVNEEKPAGNYEVDFSAKGGSASGGNAYSLPSGIYFYKLQAGSFSETRKMTLLR